ncbi:MAG TPA: hypothetical protein DDW33_06460, partial [Ktedonobacter sp.]|nr:hypothetical protein [Ktedonobacter sp.]
NREHTKKLAEALKLPTWLVKAIIVEYLPCRRFQGNKVIIDYGLVTVEDFRSFTKPYIILNGLALFHNVTTEVFNQRILSGMVGLPMVNLAKQEAFYIPEGKVSPHCLPNPIRNSDEVEGDWKLGLHLFKKAVVLDDDGIYQWTVTTNAMISADISQQWYESELFSRDELEELRRINQEYRKVGQDGFSIEEMQQRLERIYKDLEAIHVIMRKTVLEYHLTNKNKPEAKVGYTEEAPPQLTLLDEFAIVKVKDGSSKKRRIKVRSYVEPVFFRSANRAARRAREVRNGIDAGEVYPIPIAEEIEASAESIVLSAMCLEAYINGFVQDHLAKQASYIERMELRAKWLLVPAILGKADCYIPGSQPFDYFKQLVNWRNDDLAHYKHEYRFPVSLGNLGMVSELHSICNADNSELAVKTVREMIRQLNTCLGFPLPAWIQENVSVDNWLRSTVQTTNKARSETQDDDDPYIREQMHVKVIPSDAE